MNLQFTPSATTPSDSFWLTPYRDRLLASLASQGYTWRTIKTFRRLTRRICAEAESRGIGPESLDEKAMAELAETCPRTGTPYMEQELSMVGRRFTEYLIHVGVIVTGHSRASFPWAPSMAMLDRFCPGRASRSLDGLAV